MARAPLDAGDDRRCTPAAARRATGLGEVTELVADEGHCIVVEAGHDHAAAPARRHIATVLIEYLDQRVLDRHVIVRRGLAFAGDGADFLARIDAGAARAEPIGDEFARAVGNGFADQEHHLDAERATLLRGEGVGDRERAGGLREKIGGPMPRQPFQLLLHRRHQLELVKRRVGVGERPAAADPAVGTRRRRLVGELDRRQRLLRCRCRTNAPCG